VSGERNTVDAHAEAQQAPRRYQTAFEAFAANGAGDAPAWLQERRAEALAAFVQSGFPTGSQEAWRFTDLRSLARTPFALAPQATIAPEQLARTAVTLHGDRAVFVNGRFDPELSLLDGLPEGVRFGNLRDFVSAGDQVIAEHLGSYAGVEGHPFAALNTAFLADGAYADNTPSRISDGCWSSVTPDNSHYWFHLTCCPHNTLKMFRDKTFLKEFAMNPPVPSGTKSDEHYHPKFASKGARFLLLTSGSLWPLPPRYVNEFKAWGGCCADTGAPPERKRPRAFKYSMPRTL